MHNPAVHNLTVRNPTLMSRRSGLVVQVAALVTLLVAVLDTNIVASAAPSIAADFGTQALAQLPWLVTAYALAETVSQPLYGKLTDKHGVRPVMLSALALFLVGSLLCGMAPSMSVLSALRVLQGLGAAGLLSVTFTLIGHLRALSDDDASGNAAAGVLLAIGLIGGPVVGGTVVAHIGWRWIFWINVPVVVAVLVIVARHLHLAETSHKVRIDWPTAGFLIMAALAIQSLCLWAGNSFAWLSPQTAVITAVAVAAVTCVVRRQIRSATPFFPRYLLQHRILRPLTLLQLSNGIGLAGFVLYLTIDLQVVRGYSPVDAGLQLVPMAAGAIIGSIAGAVLLRRKVAIKKSFVCGTALGALTLAALALTTSSTPIGLIWAIPLFGGFGTGITMGNELLVIQSSVPLHDLGIATTGVRFIETMGSTIGAAAFGIIFADVLRDGGVTVVATMAAVKAVFAVSAAVMTLATVAAVRLPAVLPTRLTK